MNNPPNINQVLSGFVPTRQIGQGGMASIYLYENRLTGENVAVKSLHPSISTEKDSIARFYHEVQANLRLDHRNIIKILGYGEWHSTPSIVMEYIDGGDLKILIQQTGMIPPETAVFLVVQILKGLDYSHRLGIIHRDIKPSNILIDRSGLVKITDFGISRVSDLTRLTHTGDVLGTPAYMSPEQAAGEKLDERSDLFSVGVLLYEMLSGINPFLGENPSLTILNIIRCNPQPLFEVNPTIPFKLESVIDLLLQKNPADRCQTASDAAQTLNELIRELTPSGYSSDDFQTFLADPQKTISKWRVQDSRRFLESGKNLIQESQANPEAACVEFYRSLFLDPDNIEAKQYLTSITEKFAGKEEKSTSQKILELENILESDPANVAVMLQLIKRARMEGEFIKAVNYSKRLVKLRPQDPYILGQLETLLPRDQQTAFDYRHKTTELSPGSTTRVATGTRKLHSHSAASTARPISKSSKASKSIDPVYLLIAAVLIIVFFGALYLARQFRTASEGPVSEIPNLMDSIRNASQISPDKKQPDAQLFTKTMPEEAQSLLKNAEETYKTGDKRKTAEIYFKFTREFPHLPETENIRIQLANMYEALGSIDQAISVLNDQIEKGHNRSVTAFAYLTKIKILRGAKREEEARWECIHLEPLYMQLTNPNDQVSYLNIYANLCELSGQLDEARRLYDKIIDGYTNLSVVLEARLLKADLLIRQGNLLEAERELWIVRDQSRPETLTHRSALEKLDRLEKSRQGE